MMPICPRKHGLYRPEAEHDACGVGFVAHVGNVASHELLLDGLRILENMTHRGAVGANPTTGDGAGVLVQLPDSFFRALRPDLPAAVDGENGYGVGMMFLPRDEGRRGRVVACVEQVLAEEGMGCLGWREVPVERDAINDEVAACAPVIRQVFVSPRSGALGDAFERRLYVARKVIEHAVAGDAAADVGNDAAGFYCVSLSSRTLVYKGMFLAEQLGAYYPDLTDVRMRTAMALVHQRFSTNTFPAWKLAHPYRFIAHNGEINTLRGNVNNMLARHHSISSPLFGDDLEKLWPLIDPEQSDTASLDNAVELLCLAGYDPAHALATLIPEAWQNHDRLPPALAEFYRYHAPMMEPWDGPAEVVFTNGKQIGAILDRNGLRPGRYWLTDDERIIMASEAGVLPLADGKVRRKWRIEPGKILLVDLQNGRLVGNEEVKSRLSERRPYGEWRRRSQHVLDVDAEAAPATAALGASELLRQQQRFGYTEEDIKFVLRPMMEDASEPIGSMGDDTPPAVLSHRMKPLSAYFRQEFAQVTNPPIDPIREGLVMSLNTYVGARPNLLSPDSPPDSTCVRLESPILTSSVFAALCEDGTANTVALDATHAEGEPLRAAVERLRQAALAAVENGAHVLALSDRAASAERVAIPMILAASAVHQTLVASGDRTKTGLIVETGSARSVHDMAVLIGYGVEAVYPWLAYETVLNIRERRGDRPVEADARLGHYRKALEKGLLKVMSKMGIATIQSYCGAQIFEAVGLGKALVDSYFCGTCSQVDGIDVEEIERESRFWHDIAKSETHPLYADALDAGGDFAFRTRGEAHMWSPQSISALQHAVRGNAYEKYLEYARHINDQSERLMTLRGMFDFAEGESPVPLEEVEPAAEIVRRFSTGAMSFGSLSHEAHAGLAIAMNRIGGKSNTGEGGEEPERFLRDANGDTARSAIKQVASGRFGVTAEYLANSDMMQIKIAQGAKPGEGGQLPGHKVDEGIARVRCSVPGVGLISPPPHHDIYSIEDIAQLIYDLKCANPDGMVSVKLVSRAGVGTVAAGVAKAKSDHITISGHDGGTGASPLSSIKHAGTPWELGLSETHQTLVLNDLRGRVVLQVDGQIKTGRDVIIGALLGADEFGFATAPLVAQGCIMMRKCHLNTCPVGVATQDPRLRKKFAGKPEHVVNYFFFVAEEVRQYLARLGVRRLDDIIGCTEHIRLRPQTHWKSRKLDLTPILEKPKVAESIERYHQRSQEHDLQRQAIDYRWLERARRAIEDGETVEIEDSISNLHRTAGTVLSHAIAKRHGGAGLPEHQLTIRLNGVAGQSFGAFASRGMTMVLTGEANDYFGKGLSGGILVARPPESDRPDGENIIVGNTALYGATGGEAYCRGVGGERFAVRNSGALAVIEACGDHGCEYMTRGTVVVLGAVGRNFAGGMSGGIAYVLDEEGDFERRCNREMVDVRGLDRDGVLHLGKTDTENLLELLTKHRDYTGSAKAAEILDHFADYRKRFVKVIPWEYERVLSNPAAQRSA